jgi:glutamate synthase (NADPH/NADH)
MGRVAFADHVEERAIDEIEEEPTNIYEYQNVPENKSWAGALPMKQGLYDPELEKDACGVGFAAHIKGNVSHKIVIDGKFLYEREERSNHNADSTQHEACYAT